MPKQPATPTAVASTGTREVAILGIGGLSVRMPGGFLQSTALIVPIEIADTTRRRLRNSRLLGGEDVLVLVAQSR